jgi:threonine/homoserine/homoserine lactone efflux protein
MGVAQEYHGAILKETIVPAPSTLALFLIAALGLLLVPGPAVLYVVARGINQGHRVALFSVAALGLGKLIHVMAATLGLSALLLSSALAFSVVKYAGAAYLMYLGVRTLLSRDAASGAAVPAADSLGRLFRQGFVVGALNPKTALFFLAFLPQFVDPSRGSVPGQALLFGCLFVALGVCTDGAYALLSATLGGWLRGSARFSRLQRRFAGGVYVALGASTALAGSGEK